MGQETNKLNSDIMDAKNMLHQRENEVQRIHHDIQRSQDDGRAVSACIEDNKRQLATSYQCKEQQHQKIFQLTAQLK